MELTISKLTFPDLHAVDRMMKRHSSTLGFLPLAVIEDHLKKEFLLGAKTPDGRLIGYLLYAAYHDRFRIVHLCITQASRGQGLARRFLDALIDEATSQTVITLTCRNDFAAHHLWNKLDFVPIDERPGRSKEGHLLTLWRRTLALNTQLELFRANVSEDIVDIAIDAQIFFDFDEPDSEKTQPSKALISDFFIDAINIWVTDELLTEINRNHSAEARQQTRNRAKQFLQVKHDPLLLGRFTKVIKEFLPSGNDNQVSDIRHLAKVASSDIHIFVTRDQVLLNKSQEILACAGVQVMSPTELIIQLRELQETQAPVPDRVAGLGLEWRILSSKEFGSFPFERFLVQGEKLHQLRSNMESLITAPRPADVEVLWAQDDPVALRALTVPRQDTLNLSLGRVSHKADTSLIGQFLVSDVVYRAIRNNQDVVKVDASALPTGLMHYLSDMGFVECNGNFVRICFTCHLNRWEALDTIATLAPEAYEAFQTLSEHKLGRSCSPLASNMDQRCFLIPIKSAFARNLFDRQQSSYDLFGGEPDILMLWSNTYYRASTLNKMIQVPGRILWYVSGGTGEIVAVSHLDDVVVDTPKKLFRRFRKSGTLEWEDIYGLCNGDVSTELMALQFSHTFPLQRRVPLSDIWRVFDEDGIGRSLQSPRRLSHKTFRKLFELGYPKQT